MIAHCSMIPEIPGKNSLDTEYPKTPARPVSSIPASHHQKLPNPVSRQTYCGFSLIVHRVYEELSQASGQASGQASQSSQSLEDEIQNAFALPGARPRPRQTVASSPIVSSSSL